MHISSIRAWSIGSLAAAVLTFATGQAWSEGPAVSDLNAKVSGFGGASSVRDNADGLAAVAGSVTLPIAYSLGLQIDGAYAHIGDANFGNTGAHLFWRDPTAGLVGVYAGYARLDRAGGIDLGRFGGEAQYFLGQLTFDAAAGIKTGDIDDKAYGRARLQFYPVDDLMLRAGWTYENGSFATAGIEYQVSARGGVGTSLFVDADVRDGDNYAVVGGLKMTFGKDMSLKDRHRRQDPDSYTTNDLTST